MNTDDLHPQTREKYYCKEHELIYLKNAAGIYVCPFCEADV
jgi:hypothetical protein